MYTLYGMVVRRERKHQLDKHDQHRRQVKRHERDPCTLAGDPEQRPVAASVG
jgi:hypothetical protein